MSTETSNLKLTKPLETENYDINIFNENFDKIDDAVNKNTTQLNAIANEVNQLSNPNLLINGDFQVWQRGLGNNGNNYFDCTNDSKYTADRFMVCGEQGTRLTVEKQKGSGMKLIFNDHTLNTSNIRTWFDRDDILKMVGKTYTYSVEYQYEYNDPWDNGFNCFSFPDASVTTSVIKTKKIEVGFKQIRLEVTFRIDSISDDTTRMHIQWLRSNGDIDGFGYHIIKYIKLEEGSIATKFISRPYGEELALCQRYYEVTDLDDIFVGIRALLNESFLVPYHFKVEKRVIPTVKFGNYIYGDNKMYILSKTRSEEISPIIKTVDKKHVRIYLDTQDDVDSCAFCGWIKVDAEIY